MEDYSSFNKQLRKEITARALMTKKIQMLKVDIDVINEKLDEISQEINTVKKAIRRRRQKDQKF